MVEPIDPDPAKHAYYCLGCDGVAPWRLERQGDAVVTWACDEHLAGVVRGLLRDWEVSHIVVSPSQWKWAGWQS